MKCPNCQKDLEQINETEGYCNECDLTIKLDKGKAKAQVKGRIQVLEENLAQTQEELRNLKKDLTGEDSSLPFF